MKLSDLRYKPFQSNIPYDSNNLYRAIGKDGYDDFLNSKFLKPRAGGKYKETYFSKGVPQERYAGINGRKYIAEIARNVAGPEATYYKTKIYPNPILDKIRIYEELSKGNYRPVYDTFQTKNRILEGGKLASRLFGLPAAALEALIYSNDAGYGSDIIDKEKNNFLEDIKKRRINGY